jgi:hypothetical protein
MKRTVIDVCAMTSFVIVVMLGVSALRIQSTQQQRIDDNRKWLREVVEKEVIKQIKFMMPKQSGGVIK